jgi:hypothetical protein
MTDLESFHHTIDPSRPLLLLDADEVLLRFVERLETHLSTVGYELRLTSFQLSGNIYSRENSTVARPDEVKQLIAGFFDSCTHDVPLVPGVPEALQTLATDYEIAILSNIPARCRAARAESLRAQGVEVPVVSNAGEKGPAVAAIAARHAAPIVFVDDLPPQHTSVARHAPDIHRVHFVADPRLAAMIDKAEHAHVRIDDWPSLTAHLQDLLVKPQ